MDRHSLISRLGIAILGQALPEASALNAHGKQMKRAISSTIISAMLFTSFIIFGLYAFHMILLEEGVSEWVAMGVTALFGLLIAIIMGQRADSNIQKLSEVKSSLSLFPQKSEAPSVFEELASSFIEGIITEEEKSETVPSDEPSETPKERIILVKE